MWRLRRSVEVTESCGGYVVVWRLRSRVEVT